MTTTPAILAEGVRHTFGDVVALDGLDLEVEPGSVFGLLGPNGAGKTTLVRILATLLRPTAGRARVLGHDVLAEPLAVRRRIGLAGQFAAVDGELTGRENVEMIARLYRLPGGEAPPCVGSGRSPEARSASRRARHSAATAGIRSSRNS
jgi:ABC-type multidrug transport system ATPase subunit